MKRLTTITCALALAGGIAAAPAMGGSEGVAYERGCSSIKLGGPKIFYKTHLPCDKAKRWARKVYRTGGAFEPRNFNCTSGSNFVDGANCQHTFRNKNFGW